MATDYERPMGGSRPVGRALDQSRFVEINPDLAKWMAENKGMNFSNPMDPYTFQFGAGKMFSGQEMRDRGFTDVALNANYFRPDSGDTSQVQNILPEYDEPEFADMAWMIPLAIATGGLALGAAGGAGAAAGGELAAGTAGAFDMGGLAGGVPGAGGATGWTAAGGFPGVTAGAGTGAGTGFFDSIIQGAQNLGTNVSDAFNQIFGGTGTTPGGATPGGGIDLSGYNAGDFGGTWGDGSFGDYSAGGGAGGGTSGGTTGLEGANAGGGASGGTGGGNSLGGDITSGASGSGGNIMPGSGGGSPFGNFGVGDIVKGLANYLLNQGLADDYEDAANQAAHLANTMNDPRRAPYQGMLLNLMSNPTQFYETNPVVRAQMDLAKQQFEANTAKMGTGGTQFSNYLRNVQNNAASTFNDQANILSVLGGFNQGAGYAGNVYANLMQPSIQQQGESYRLFGDIGSSIFGSIFGGNGGGNSGGVMNATAGAGASNPFGNIYDFAG